MTGVKNVVTEYVEKMADTEKQLIYYLVSKP